MDPRPLNLDTRVNPSLLARLAGWLLDDDEVQTICAGCDRRLIDCACAREVILARIASTRSLDE